MVGEMLRWLAPRPGERYVDATADGGGHALAILGAIGPNGKLLALEWDETLFQELTRRFQQECTPSSKNYILQRTNYTALERCARSLAFAPAAGVLFDFGLSSYHLEASKRGFSFLRDEPLDMRYSADTPETAEDLIAHRSERELAEMIHALGGERFARRIARAIVAVRPIRRTSELVRVILRAVPDRYRRSRIHAATRTFQALRMAVNREIENISLGLAAAGRILKPRGRIVTISFHSLEDRAVKDFFRADSQRGLFAALTPKPVRPLAAEVAGNPRARSARLRAYEKLP